jgi:hypothetical protein
MKPKTILTVALLAFVACSVVYLIVDEIRAAVASRPLHQAAGSEATVVSLDDRLIAYYFHATARCATCRTIEAFTQEAILGGFEEAIADGRLEWKVLNYEESPHRHFVKDYDLYANTVVLVEFRNGKQTRWKTLDEVWNLTDDKPAFLRYVRGEVRDYQGAD